MPEIKTARCFRCDRRKDIRDMRSVLVCGNECLCSAAMICLVCGPPTPFVRSKFFGYRRKGPHKMKTFLEKHECQEVRA